MESEPDIEGSPPGPALGPSQPVWRMSGKLTAIVIVALALIATVAFLVRPPNQPLTIHQATLS